MIHELYDIDITSLISFIEKHGFKRILLQAPDGLKPLLPYLINGVKRVFGNDIELFVSGSPTYGSCDIAFDEAEAIGAELIVHVGHNKHPFVEDSVYKIPVYYIPAFYKLMLDKQFLKKISVFLEKIGVSSVVVIASLQYIRQAKQIHGFLEESFIKVIKGVPRHKDMMEYQVLGCEYSAINLASNADAILVVSSGLFHGIGACLYSKNTRTIIIDVEKKNIIDLSNLCRKILAKRLYIVSKIMNSNFKKTCIVTGVRPGQYRGSIMNSLASMFIRNNVEVTRAIVHYVNKDVLSALDNAFSPDFFVVTNCPRLPIDDLGDFYKPVLTPGEAVMVLKKSLDYVFPW